MNYLRFVGKANQLQFRYDDKEYIITSFEDWNAAIATIKSAPNYTPQSFQCASGIDWPEDETNDAELIELCYAIRSAT